MLLAESNVEWYKIAVLRPTNRFFTFLFFVGSCCLFFHFCLIPLQYYFELRQENFLPLEIGTLYKYRMID